MRIRRTSAPFGSQLVLAALLSALAVSAPAGEAVSPDPSAAKPAPAAGETLAQRHLREAAAREQVVWERLRRNPEAPEEKARAEADFRDILTAYSVVVREAPDSAEAWTAYGLLLGRTGNREESATALLRANRIDPNLPVVKNQLGNFLFEDGEYRAALPYYLAATGLAPEEPLYHYNLGSLLHEYRRFFIADGMFTRATLDARMQSAFRRAAELAPAKWAYAYRYAESFYDLETPDWPAALQAWEALEQRTPAGGIEAQTIRLQRANVLGQAGRAAEARALLDTVTEPALAENKKTLVERLAEMPED
jgi:tetratricopeptide (TPR) repeat protein